MSRLSLLALLGATLLPVTALAERGALTVEGGGGVSAALVPAPYAIESRSLLSTATTVRLGARYALTNSLEVGVSGFYEPTVQLWHSGVSIDAGAQGTFSGTLAHRAGRVGGTVGARFYTGMTWRFVAGLEVGWSHRSYDQFILWDVSNPRAARDYGLEIPDFTTDNLLFAPTVGLEWMGGDRWSLALLPRADVLLGPSPTVAFSVPLVFSWAFYL